jgi:CRP-like cAMP-binding protein
MKIINDEQLKNQILAGYDTEKIFGTNLKSSMDLFHFEKDEYICRAEEELEYLFFFIKGRAKVFTLLKNGKSLLLCLYQDFQIIGEVELFTNSTCTTYVQALTDVYCIGVKLSIVKQQLLNDNTFLRYMSSSLASKLRRTTKNCSFNLLYPLENRLAAYILITAVDLKLDVNLTPLAEQLATSYRHLLRVFQKFCKQGILKKQDSHCEILDKAQLEALSSESGWS